MSKVTGWSSDDWYKDGEGQLHFFPHAKRLVWTVGRRIVAETEAWGGVQAERGVKYPNMKPRRTTPGSYVIADHGPYVTPKWERSQIAWGTRLKRDPGGRYVLYESGGARDRWNRLDRLIPGCDVTEVRALYRAYYGDSDIYDVDRDGIPEKWVFNDFGPWVVRYYPDPNRNRRRDAGERISGEMIHTTPENEAEMARGFEIRMTYSHGCIHIKPAARPRFLVVGAFKSGNLMVVHGPSEVVPEFLAR